MKIEKVLESYGLNEKQIRVYIACLELGSASVQKISQKSGLVRTSVYETLETLKQKGFVNLFFKKKVKHYSAEEPDKILKLERRKLDSLSEVLPDLNALYGKARHRPRVRFYQGKESLQLVMEEILSEAAELISFGSADDLLREMGDYHQNFVARRVKKKIPLRVILKDTKTARSRKSLEIQHQRQVRFARHNYDFHGLIFVWQNKIAMFSLTTDLVGVVIDSQELAATQKALFDNLWHSLPA